MKIDVKLGLDLGGDSLKIAYAYENSMGEISCGKLARSYFEDTFPSSAYYDEKAKNWIFGEKIYTGLEKTYRTIVKIKDLFNLLRTKEDSEYFYKFNEFRIFHFPERITQFATFSDAIKAGETFKSVNTPSEVCTIFFNHVADYYIRPSLKRLQEVILAKESQPKKTKMEIVYELVNVYPVKCGGVYIHEMRKIFAEMVKRLPDTVSEGRAVSVSKAVGLYAYHEKKFENKSSALVVDVGENSVSLLKIKADGAAVQAEGEDGHDVLFDIGGRDYDEALAKVVREKSNTRMMLGEKRKSSQKSREDEGTSLQQFCLNMRVKNAKTRLSSAQTEDHIVRVEFESDVSVQVPVTKREFLEGLEQGTGAAAVSQKIADGIVKELSHADNRTVTHVILSGGASVTSGLKDTVKSAIAGKFKNKTVVDFELKTKVVPTDEFTLLNEKGIFAPGLGATILATGKYKIVTVAALSYGTWVRESDVFGLDDVAQKKLRILLKKGTEIPPDGDEYKIALKTGRRTNVIENDEIFSTPSVEEFVVGEPGSELRRNAIKDKKLKVISGKKGGGRIRFSQIVSENYVFTEGILVDRDGKVTPYVGKTDANKEDGIRVWIEGLDSFTVSTEDKEKTVK